MMLGWIWLVLLALVSSQQPLWRLDDVVDMSRLMRRAQGTDRAGFLDLLAEADPDSGANDESTQPGDDDEDDDDEDDTTTESSSTDPGASAPRQPKRNVRKVKAPQFVAPMPPLPPVPAIPGFRPQGDPAPEELGDDDLKWFNAQAFMKWFVKGLTALYEGLVKLMLLPLHVVISVIDV